MDKPIDLGHGMTIEPDRPPRRTEFHRKILAVRPIPNTRSGHYIDLNCGHEVISFGDLSHAQGRVLCTVCRAAALERQADPA